MFISLLIYIQFGIWTLLYTVLSAPFFTAAMLACSIFRRGRGQDAVVRFFILWYGKTILRVALFPYVWIRSENQAGVPTRGGLFVFNHRSGSDPFLTSLITMVPPAQIVNDWPMRLPFLGFFARRGNYLDIKNMDYNEIRDRIRDLVERGVPVMAFPEGTRSGNCEMNPFHGTVFRVAKEIGCPIFPVAVAGNENIPDRHFRMHPGMILIRKLAAIDPEFIREASTWRLKERVHEILASETQQMDAVLKGANHEISI